MARFVRKGRSWWCRMFHWRFVEYDQRFGVGWTQNVDRCRKCRTWAPAGARVAFPTPPDDAHKLDRPGE